MFYKGGVSVILFRGGVGYRGDRVSRGYLGEGYLLGGG